MWIILSLVSAFTFSLRQFAEKRALRGSDPVDTVVAFSIIKMAITLPLLFLVSPVPIKIHLLLLLVTFLDMVVTVLQFKAIKQSELSSLAPFFGLTPVFVVVLGIILLSEVPTMAQAAGIGLTIAGIYILLSAGFRHIAAPKYMAFATAAAILMAVIGIILRYSLLNASAFSVYFFSLLYFTLGAVFLQVIRGRVRKIPQLLAGKKWAIAQGSVYATVSNFAAYLALSNPQALAALVIPIRRTSVLFSVVLGGMLLKEANIARKIAAGFFILAGIMLIAI